MQTLFINIHEYMTNFSREDRRQHLLLSSPCLEIGGSSGDFRGLLAHYLKTTVPEKVKTKRTALLCHACNNGKCSNPLHLYWGTDLDNHIDRVEASTYESLPKRMERKYGKEYMWKLRSNAGKKGGKKGGGHNRLTDAQIAEYKEMFRAADPAQRGWIAKLSRKTGFSHTHIRRMYERIMSEVELPPGLEPGT